MMLPITYSMSWDDDDERSSFISKDLSFRENIVPSKSGHGLNVPKGWHASVQNSNKVTFERDGGLRVEFSSRRHRKGRRPKVYFGSVPQRVEKRFRFVSFEPYNISWWVASTCFVAASIWTVSSIFEVSDILDPITSARVVNILDFICSSVFLVSAYLQYLEALNESETVLDEGVLSMEGFESGEVSYKYPETSVYRKKLQWRWKGLRWDRIGLAASNFDLFGAILYTIGSLFALPTATQTSIILPSNWVARILFVELFELLGSCLFAIASVLLMVEVQDSPCVPKLDAIAWYASFANFIGACGFLAQSATGFVNSDSPIIENTGAWFGFIGSTGFLICSCLLLVEVGNKE